ncbi:MAG: 50S ribosomal protein L11 methyltransferase [Nitratireductor sp.]|nr:50S ribosomal protein L11 methyltransferase [Nitratireductor sp.]
MNQIRLYFECPARQATELAGELETRFEADGYPVASFESDEAKGLWSVSVYLPPEEEGEAEAAIREILSVRDPAITIAREVLGDEDWVTRTLEGLAPVRAGGRFVVHGSHDRGCARAHEHAILIDAALAFGSGHHGTTAGCLDMIGREMKRRRFKNALDLGSGTGVLAIAIAKAMHCPVLASDIDPVAMNIAAENARLNGVGALIASITAAGFTHPSFAARKPFDLIVANILARPLQAMAADLARHAASGGTVILSGLLPHQRARITAAYRLQGLHLAHTRYRDGWMTLVLLKPSARRT